MFLLTTPDRYTDLEDMIGTAITKYCLCVYMHIKSLSLAFCKTSNVSPMAED